MMVINEAFFCFLRSFKYFYVDANFFMLPLFYVVVLNKTTKKTQQQQQQKKHNNNNIKYVFNILLSTTPTRLFSLSKHVCQTKEEFYGPSFGVDR